MMISTQTYSVTENTTEKVIRPKLYSITQIPCNRSAGTVNEFYSEGDYWWPASDSKSGLPYENRDGLSNPDIFNEHRKLLMDMSQDVAFLTLQYGKTGDFEYAKQVSDILYHWFLNPKTRMEPHLKYSQAIPGVCTGRGLGIIDTLHLAETALAILNLQTNGALDKGTLKDLKKWFTAYLEWLVQHEYGIEERNHGNNHSVCWYLQTAAFATLTGNQDVLNICRSDYKQILLPEQMAADGSFPYELRRTKPYCYSIFNLEAMAALCQLLSCPGDNLFEYQTADGLSLRNGIEFIYPYLVDKNTWPYGRDIAHWESWPSRQPCLLFAGMAYNESKYLELWRKMPVLPRDFEAVRNTPVKNPELWMKNTLNY